MSELCLHRAIIGLGSNLGEPEAQLAGALERMSRCGKLIATSSYYKTKPLLHPLMPFYGQSDFTNACAVLETRFGPIELLSQLPIS